MIFLVFGNQFVKLFLLGFHDGFADHFDVVVIDSNRDRDDLVFSAKPSEQRIFLNFLLVMMMQFSLCSSVDGDCAFNRWGVIVMKSGENFLFKNNDMSDSSETMSETVMISTGGSICLMVDLS